MRKAPAIAVIASLAIVGVTSPGPAVGDHGGSHFISKKRAKAMLRERIRDDARRRGQTLSRMRLERCRYGRTETWNRPRWLCDLTVEIDRRTYCGWGRVIKWGGKAYTNYEASRFNC